MPVKKGSTNFGSLYLGSTKIAKAYLGSILVFGATPQPTSVTIDGKVYPATTINGRAWTTVNLDYKYSGFTFYTEDTPGMGAISPPDSGMYYNYTTTPGDTGLLYNRQAVMELASIIPTVAPGWQVPTQSDWQQLFAAVGGSSVAGLKLKSTTGWTNNGNGDGSTSFNALPVGIAVSAGLDSAQFGNDGKETGFWSRTYDGNGTQRINISYYFTNTGDGAYLRRTNAHWLSVRLVYKG